VAPPKLLSMNIFARAARSETHFWVSFSVHFAHSVDSIFPLFRL